MRELLEKGPNRMRPFQVHRLVRAELAQTDTGGCRSQAVEAGFKPRKPL
jgi:hypothetical protein